MSATNPTKFIEHIALFKAKDEVDAEKNAELVDSLNKLSTVKTGLYQSAGLISNLRSPSSSFNHMSYMRFATEDHLREFDTHPTHLGVSKEIRPFMEDVMVVDWWHEAETTGIPPGSVLRVTFLKLKEGLPGEEKDEVLGVIGGMKDKFPAIQELSFGENITPKLGKGFSIASIAVFKDAGELEKAQSEWEAAVNDELKDKVRGKMEEAMVFDYLIA